MTVDLNVQGSDTIRAALAAVTRAFEAANLPSSSVDARYLLQGILKCEAAALLRDPDRIMGGNAAAHLSAAANRRLAHEPVSRILGTREFYGRPFRVTPDVLDPRPDTETLVELVLDVVRADARFSKRVMIADIGVGSGAIIATLLAELPHATGIATDVSAAALDVARDNAAALGVGNRLTLVNTSGLSGITAPIDIVVSNPPYIPSPEIAGLALDVVNFDPPVALDGGPDGLQTYRKIAGDISALGLSCWLCLEFGAGQVDDVEAVFAGVGGIPQERRADLGGHVRAVALKIQHRDGPQNQLA